MSKINDLIAKLCPNGVKYKTIGEISTYRRGSFPQPYTNSSYYGGEGAMPFVQVADIQDEGFKLKDNTKQTISKIAQPKSIFVPKGSVICSIQGTIGRVAITQYDAYVDRTIAIFDGFKIEMNKRFFAYCIQIKFGIEKEFARGSTLKTITKEEFTKFCIPVPPLEVQCEIVHVLDNFTLLSAELSAELKARQKQYEYYRDNLLEFSNTIKRMKFGEIATIQRGASPRPISQFITDKEDGVNWIKIGDVESGTKYITQCKEKITIEGAKKSRFVRKGDFILSNSMSFGRPYILQIDGCIHDGWLSISNFNEYYISDFLYHLLNSSNIQNQFKQKASFGGAVQNLNADIVRGIELPVPSLEQQKKIIRILDKFEKICNDISEGLPAEIEKRQKQYEYYRNKLLNFKELKVEE